MLAVMMKLLGKKVATKLDAIVSVVAAFLQRADEKYRQKENGH